MKRSKKGKKKIHDKVDICIKENIPDNFVPVNANEEIEEGMKENISKEDDMTEKVDKIKIKEKEKDDSIADYFSGEIGENTFLYLGQHIGDRTASEFASSFNEDTKEGCNEMTTNNVILSPSPSKLKTDNDSPQVNVFLFKSRRCATTKL